jgi:hypothetical protein
MKKPYSTPPAPAPAPTIVSVPPPELVGTIVPPEPPRPPDVKLAYHIPDEAELAQFGAKDTPVFPVGSPQAPAGGTPPFGVGMPLGPTVRGDKSVQLGVVLYNETATPKIYDTAPEPELLPPEYSHLPRKTQAELRAGWLKTHSSMEGFHLPSGDIFMPAIKNDKPIVRDESVDISKLTLKTQLELEAGKARLARRDADYRDVLQRVAANEIAAMETSKAEPANMDYETPKR